MGVRKPGTQCDLDVATLLLSEDMLSEECSSGVNTPLIHSQLMRSGLSACEDEWIAYLYLVQVATQRVRSCLMKHHLEELCSEVCVWKQGLKGGTNH